MTRIFVIKNVLAIMVANSTNINKVNNNLSSRGIKNKKTKT